jgi:hypothetical protein
MKNEFGGKFSRSFLLLLTFDGISTEWNEVFPFDLEGRWLAFHWNILGGFEGSLIKKCLIPKVCILLLYSFQGRINVKPHEDKHWNVLHQSALSSTFFLYFLTLKLGLKLQRKLKICINRKADWTWISNRSPLVLSNKLDLESPTKAMNSSLQKDKDEQNSFNYVNHLDVSIFFRSEDSHHHLRQTNCCGATEKFQAQRRNFKDSENPLSRLSEKSFHSRTPLCVLHIWSSLRCHADTMKIGFDAITANQKRAN